MDRHTLVWGCFFSLKVRGETCHRHQYPGGVPGRPLCFSRHVINGLTSGLWAHHIHMGWNTSILCTGGCRPWRESCPANLGQGLSLTDPRTPETEMYSLGLWVKRGMLHFHGVLVCSSAPSAGPINHCLDNSAFAKLCGPESLSLVYCHGSSFAPFLPHPQKSWIQFLHSLDKRSLGAFYCLAWKARKVEMRLIALLTR